MKGMDWTCIEACMVGGLLGLITEDCLEGKNTLRRPQIGYIMQQIIKGQRNKEEGK